MELEELSVVEKAAMLSGGSEWDSRGNAREAPLMEELLLETAKNPSAAALSGEQPFALIERVRPCSLQMRIHSGHR